MDDPPTQVAEAINAVAAAPTPTSQVVAIRKYFAPHASFVYPVVYVPPSSPNSSFRSRDRIESIYRLYRLLIPLTYFTFRDIGWTDHGDGTGKLWIDLTQCPYMRGVTTSTDWRPAVEMAIHLWVVRGEGGRWVITKQEDMISPFAFAMAFPGVRWLVGVVYWVAMWFAVAIVWVAGRFGLWSPSQRPNEEEVELKER